MRGPVGSTPGAMTWSNADNYLIIGNRDTGHLTNWKLATNTWTENQSGYLSIYCDKGYQYISERLNGMQKFFLVCNWGSLISLFALEINSPGYNLKRTPQISVNVVSGASYEGTDWLLTFEKSTANFLNFDFS